MTQIKKHKPEYKIIGINVLVMFFYSLLIRIIGNSADTESILGVAIFLALVIALHVGVCLVVAIIGRPKEWLLSGLAVLLLGFSTCAAVCSIKI